MGFLPAQQPDHRYTLSAHVVSFLLSLLLINDNILKSITFTILNNQHWIVFLRAFQVWYIASFILNSMLQLQAILLQPFTSFTKGTDLLKWLHIFKIL